jgi:hypothetical protein
MKCILSGIEIPPRKYSVEHYCPRCHLPIELAKLPYNIYPAIKVFNNIKGALYPCEWEEQKYDRIYHALNNWNLKNSDRKLCRQALNGMPKINPCDFCIASIYSEYCIKGR